MQAQVFVFDTQRGVKEGEEEDKILAFYPPSATSSQQQARVCFPCLIAAADALSGRLLPASRRR